jgi:hypothetical protein
VSGLVQNLQNVQLATQNEQEHDASHTGANINDIEDRIGKHCALIPVSLLYVFRS